MKARVAIVRTKPASVIDDVHRLVNHARWREALDPAVDTALKANISWHFFFPATSSTPWQMDGVVRALLRDGFDREKIHVCHNRTVVVDARLGERENKHIDVVRAHGLRNVHLYDAGEEWIDVRKVAPAVADAFLVLNDVFPDGFSIPKRFVGENVIHLPTMKTHVFTTTTGAMKNAFGGLLNEKRHWTHPVIHETLVDLLALQKSIHAGVFAVMDGTFAGDGPGPRCMVPYTKNVMLASADQVAIDAVAAKIMGFDPRSIRYLQLAQERGLGCADPRDIELTGDVDAAEENWHFEGPHAKMTFAARQQHRIYWGPLKRPIEWSLKTWLAPWAYMASVGYHDVFWYPFVGKPRVQATLDSDWGRLFANWADVRCDGRGFPDVGGRAPDLQRMGARDLVRAARLLASSAIS